MNWRCSMLAWTALAMSLACKPVEKPPLPLLEAPRDLTDRHEAVFLHAHLEQLLRSIENNDDVIFDDTHKFAHHQFFLMCCDLRAWERSVDVGADWLDYDLKQRMLALTPEASAYRGARLRAVALGLLAESILWHDPPQVVLFEHELFAEGRAIAANGPRTYPDTFEWHRAAALQRMISMGLHADAELYDKQSRRFVKQWLARQEAQKR